MHDDDTINEESAMIMMRSLVHNDSVTELGLPSSLRHKDSVKREIQNINFARIKHNSKSLKVYF